MIPARRMIGTVAVVAAAALAVAVWWRSAGVLAPPVDTNTGRANPVWRAATAGVSPSASEESGTQTGEARALHSSRGHKPGKAAERRPSRPRAAVPSSPSSRQTDSARSSAAQGPAVPPPAGMPSGNGTQPPPLPIADPVGSAPDDPQATATDNAPGRPTPGATPDAQPSPPRSAAPVLTPPVPVTLLPPRHPQPYQMVIEWPGLTSAVRAQGVEVRVRLRLVVRTDGTVGRVEVAVPSGRPDLDSAAVAAARTWRFLPARRDGEPIESIALIWIAFTAEP